MTMTATWLSGASLTLGALMLSSLCPTSARACSRINCLSGQLWGAGSSIPSNGFELVFRPPVDLNRTDAGVAAPKLYDVTNGQRVELLLTTHELAGLVHVVPRDGVSPGAKLTFEYDDPCGAQPKRIVHDVQVGAAQPLPSTLGSVQVAVGHGSHYVPVSSGECSVALPTSYVDLAIILSAEARPFASVLRYEFLIDGVPRTSEGDLLKTTPASSYRAFAPCVARPGIRGEYTTREGNHSALITATLPNGTTLRSDPVQFELRCDPSWADGGVSDAGAQSAPDAATHTTIVADATVPSSSMFDGGSGGAGPTGVAARSASDAGHADAASAAQVDLPDDASADDSGCAATGSTPASATWLWLLLGVLGRSLAQRRQRASVRTTTRCEHT